ncbi:MAG: AraC family transcriptional regulator [Candidatus Promineifilaceae bacterium]|nr:AraC family transcriptional regulator [Candidatus Promineifilaceae bacterium]
MTAVEIDHLHYESSLVRIGSFRCPPTHPEFDTAGQITSYLLAFPRTSVYIQHASAPPVIADPNVVMLYNPGQEYRRKALSEKGDRTDWFTFSPATVREVLQPVDPAAAEREQLFLFSHSPSAPYLYLRQRLVLQHTTSGGQDRLFIEETMQEVLAQVVVQAYRAAGRDPRQRQKPQRQRRARTERAHRELVEGARALLARRYAASLTLEEIAGALYTSPYHLARLFRRHTGQTIHSYRNQMRLHASLERVADGVDLSQVALDLGYGSHSHFSSAFSSAYGFPPSTFRQAASARTVREMSKILTV